MNYIANRDIDDKIANQNLTLKIRKEQIKEKEAINNSYIPSYKVPEIKPIYNNIEQITILNDRNLNAKIDNEERAKVARKGIREVNKKFNTDLTKEAIEELRQRYNTPIVVDGITYKYVPVKRPELELYEPIEEELTTEDIVKINNKINENLEKIKKLNKIYEAIPEELKKANNEYNELSMRLTEVDDTKTENNTEVKNKIVKLRNIAREIQRIELLKKNEILEEIKTLKTEIENLYYNLKLSDENKKVNESEKDRVRKYNEPLVKEYEYAVKSGSRNKLNPQQDQNETDEDYLNRLQDTVNEEVNDEVALNEAKSFNISLFKQNMKQLIRDDSKIENVLKKILNVSNDELFKTNKIFNLIKTEFLKRYGENNPYITATDIFNFIDAVSSKEPYEKIEQPKEIKKIDVVKLQTASPEELLRILEELEKLNHETKQTDKNTASYNIFKEILTQSNGQPKTEITPEQRAHIIKSFARRKAYKLNDKTYGEIIGYGIHNDPKLTDHAVFGNVFLDLKKLFYDNLLSISNKHRMKYNGYKNVKISDDFVKLIINFVKNGNISNSDIKKLSVAEKRVLDSLLFLAKLHKHEKIDIEIDDTIKYYKEKLELIIGEIEAGNDNKILIKQLHDILYKLTHLKVISVADANRYYKEYSKKN